MRTGHSTILRIVSLLHRITHPRQVPLTVQQRNSFTNISHLSAILCQWDLFAGVAAVGVAFTVATLRLQRAQVLSMLPLLLFFLPLLTLRLFVLLLFKTIVRIILIALRRPSLFICLNLSHSVATTSSAATSGRQWLFCWLLRSGSALGFSSVGSKCSRICMSCNFRIFDKQLFCFVFFLWFSWLVFCYFAAFLLLNFNFLSLGQGFGQIMNCVKFCVSNTNKLWVKCIFNLLSWFW